MTRHLLLFLVIGAACSTDDSDNTQVVDANVVTVGIPTGSIMAFGGATVPDGWLPCDGTLLDASKAEYANLYAAIGIAYGGNTTSRMFNLPDLRGRFVRGWDHGAGNDPDRDARTATAAGGNTGDAIGSLQTDLVGAHTHPFSAPRSLNFTVASGSSFRYNEAANQTTGESGGSETRPKNVTVSYIIKL